MKNSIGSMLVKRADLQAQTEAFVDVQRDIRRTYRQYNLAANRIADVLDSKGVQKGDRVAVLMLNCCEFMELFFAIAKIGAICVPLNCRLVADELSFILKDSGTKLLVYGDELKEVVADIHARGRDVTDIEHWLHITNDSTPDTFASDFNALKNSASEAEPELAGFEDDPLFIMYTSGTTGLPKGAVHTHNTVTWAVINMDATWELRHDDRFFVPLPLFHVAALLPSIMSVYTGITVVTMKSFDPSLAWKTIEVERVTNSLMVPTIINFMLQRPEIESYNYSSLRWVSIAGAPVPVSMLEACENIGIRLEQLFGLTEACGPGCLLTGSDVPRKPGSAGKGFLFIDVRVVDSEGNDVPANQPGELILSGKNIMRGYWNRPDDSAKALRNGWLHTGDVATMDEEGFIYIVDRVKDMIISGGENIYPAEIEKVIAGMPGVESVAVIGKQDDKWGEVPMAVIVAGDTELDASGVIEYCKDKLAGYKLPKSVAFIDELPLTATGKLQKRVLKQKMESKS